MESRKSCGGSSDWPTFVSDANIGLEGEVFGPTLGAGYAMPIPSDVLLGSTQAIGRVLAPVAPNDAGNPLATFLPIARIF